MEIHGKDLKIHATHKTPPAPHGMTGDVKLGDGVEQTEQVKPQRLLERLQGDAEVRSRLLVEIQAKFQAGEYSTRVAAERAATQIIGL
jgi:hypothetical protein